MMRFEALLERHERGDLSQAEAAELLGIGNGHFGAGAIAMRMRGRQGLRIGGWGGPRRIGLRLRRWSGCSGSIAPITRASR